MKVLYSTDPVAEKVRFRRWRETIIERVMPLEISEVGAGPFSGRIEAAQVGGLTVNRITTTGIRTELTKPAIRRSEIRSTITVALQTSGAMTFSQADREVTTARGDLVVLDRQPSSIVAPEGGQGLFVEIPQERLERAIGPAKLYSRMRVPGELATTQLALRYVQQLLEVHRKMEAGQAERMGSIGVDMLIASIAERLAQNIPRTLHGTVVVQRAKAHIEDMLHDPALSPADLAAAIGVSLRRLQELFHDRSQNISDYIWERRLAVAAQRLREPKAVQMPIGLLAYTCGFTSQAHFSRRFKDRYGASPREFRMEAFEHASIRGRLADCAAAHSHSIVPGGFEVMS